MGNKFKGFDALFHTFFGEVIYDTFQMPLMVINDSF